MSFSIGRIKPFQFDADFLDSELQVSFLVENIVSYNVLQWHNHLIGLKDPVVFFGSTLLWATTNTAVEIIYSLFQVSFSATLVFLNLFQ